MYVCTYVCMISSIILLPTCHTLLIILVWRIWYWMKLQSTNLCFSIFSSLVYLRLYWYCKEKFCLGHNWEWKGYTQWVTNSKRELNNKITKLQLKEFSNVSLKIPHIKNTKKTLKLITINTNVTEIQTQQRKLEDTAQFFVIKILPFPY